MRSSFFLLAPSAEQIAGALAVTRYNVSTSEGRTSAVGRSRIVYWLNAFVHELSGVRVGRI